MTSTTAAVFVNGPGTDAPMICRILRERAGSLHVLSAEGRTGADIAALAGADVGILVVAPPWTSARPSLHGGNGEIGQIAEQIRIELSRPLELIGSILPGMIERGRGHVVCLTDVVGGCPTGATLRAALNAALTATVPNLRLESIGTQIRYTELRLGPVHVGPVPDPFAAADHLREEDVAVALAYALDAPTHVDVTLVEISGRDHVLGGSRLQ